MSISLGSQCKLKWINKMSQMWNCFVSANTCRSHITGTNLENQAMGNEEDCTTCLFWIQIKCSIKSDLGHPVCFVTAPMGWRLKVTMAIKLLMGSNGKEIYMHLHTGLLLISNSPWERKSDKIALGGFSTTFILRETRICSIRRV